MKRKVIFIYILLAVLFCAAALAEGDTDAGLTVDELMAWVKRVVEYQKTNLNTEPTIKETELGFQYKYGGIELIYDSKDPEKQKLIIGPASGYILFPAEGHAAVTAIPRTDNNPRLIDKSHVSPARAARGQTKSRPREIPLRRLEKADSGKKLGSRNDADPGLDLVLAGIFFKLHNPVNEGEKRIVLAHADVGAGMDLGAVLPHQDVARQNRLAAELLHAEPLTGAVASIAGTSACLFMSHIFLLGWKAEYLLQTPSP